MKKYKYAPAKHLLQFQCPWAVYPIGGTSSLCYATNKFYARLISLSLNRFMNSDEGKEWIAKNGG